MYERVAGVMERRRVLAGQIRGSQCTAAASAASAARILDWVCLGFVSVLSRFCLGVVSVLSRCCLGFVSVLSRCCLGFVTVLSRCCLDFVSVLPQCCLLCKHTVETHG